MPSPTFTLVEVYAFAGRPPVWHFDLYRLTAPEQAWELGVEDAFAEGISLIEWPERLGPLLPAERLDAGARITAPRPTARIARFSATAGWAAASRRHRRMAERARRASPPFSPRPAGAAVPRAAAGRRRLVPPL